MAAILDFWVIMMSLRQTYVRIGILVVDVPEKVSSYMLNWFKSYVFVLPSGVHLGFMCQGDVIASN